MLCKSGGNKSIFILKMMFVYVSLLMIGKHFYERFQIAYDPQTNKCIPQYSLYLIDKYAKELVRGNLYAFHSKGLEPIYNDNTRMVKFLVAEPGDRVRIDSNQYIYINSKYLTCCLHAAEKLNIPASQFMGETILKDNQYWFMGNSTDSFDSRYWGAVTREQVIGRAYAVF